MKKAILISVALLLCLLTACQQQSSSNPSGNDAPTQTQPTSPPVGDPVEGELVYIFDANGAQYTADTLPNNYLRKDFDGDGLKNQDEIKYNTDMYHADTDGDGIGDGNEISSTKTDPTKWSSRDDGMSDLEYSIINEGKFQEGYTETNIYGFKIYLAKPEDRLWIITKTSTDIFNDLETISEAFQVKCFSGKIALNCNKYVAEVANSISVYKDVNGVATKVETIVDGDNLVNFEVQANDVFVLVYEPKE